MTMFDPPLPSAGSGDELLALRLRLQDLHRRAGKPSYRQLATRIQALSHTTVHIVIRCERLPRWGNLELVVEALAGDVEEFRRLWLTAEAAASTTVGPAAATKAAVDARPGHVAHTGQSPEPLKSPATPPASPSRPRRQVLISLSAVLAAATTGVAVTAWLHNSPDQPAERHPSASKSGQHTVPLNDTLTGEPLGGPLSDDDHGAVWTVKTGTLDGRTVVVTGRQDGVLQVWDLATGAVRGGPLAGHTKAVYSVSVGSLNGRATAVSGSVDGTLRLWDLTDGRSAGRQLGGAQSSGSINGVALGTLGGRTVAVSAGDDGTVRLWDLTVADPSGRPLGERLSTAVKAVAVGDTGDRTIAVTGGDDHAVRLWDLSADHPVARTLGDHDGTIWSLALGTLDDRPFALSAGDDGTTRVWNLTVPEPVGRPLGPQLDTAVKAVAVAKLGSRSVAFSGGDDGVLRGWDLATGHPYETRTAPSGIEALTTHAVGDRLTVLAGLWSGATWKWTL
ncbi:WD40 repeat domain-containing protein [Streptomyces graminifolii]|uniref:WD40 repeat domain-containing protein n=1 Tax=Streptomyces graminifolii TaxID=1266771 RepID=UPI0040581AB9